MLGCSARLADVLHQADHVSARSDNFGLHEAFVGRAGRAKGCKIIVAAIGRRIVVRHRADSDDVRHVAGNADRLCAGARVTGGGNHDDARFPGGHDGLIQRIVPVVRAGRRAQRHVDDVDADACRGYHNPVDGADDVSVTALSIFIEEP